MLKMLTANNLMRETCRADFHMMGAYVPHDRYFAERFALK